MFKVGMKVMPLTGFWKGCEGVILEVAEIGDYPIHVEFEENETNNYYEEQLELI
jgi:hypothetical protein